MPSTPPPDDPSGTLIAAERALLSAFGTRPRGAAIAPGRVNLIGEHTDYSEGYVLPIAIDRRCAAAAETNSTGVIRACSRESGGVESAGRAERPAPGSWFSYAAGAAALTLDAIGADRGTGVDLGIAGDVPLGSGLSSSAALEVAVSLACQACAGRSLGPMRTAAVARRAEHEYAGVPCGVMDQIASACGAEGSALLIDCRDLGTRPVPLPGPDRLAVVVINSGVRHSLGAGEYAERRRWCESAARTLGVTSLRDADLSMTCDSSLPDEQRRAVEHVVGENARVHALVAAFGAGDLHEAGRILGASHASLRDVFRVSCPELDAIVDLCSRVDGVYGSRMTGGGFGGCAIALAAPEAVGELSKAIETGYRAPNGARADFFVTRASAGAREIRV